MSVNTLNVASTKLLTTGLNKPPLIRKKVQAVTAKLNPAATAAYNSCDGDAAGGAVETPFPWSLLEDAPATSTPAKARKTKMRVPRNSPTTATTWPRAEGWMSENKLLNICFSGSTRARLVPSRLRTSDPNLLSVIGGISRGSILMFDKD